MVLSSVKFELSDGDDSHL